MLGAFRLEKKKAENAKKGVGEKNEFLLTASFAFSAS